MAGLLAERPPRLKRDEVVRLWLDRQGHLKARGRRLTRAAFIALLQDTGGLQLDSVNVLDRAHYLTLWSRFGAFDRAKLDAWVYGERLAFDFLAHQACLVAPSRLPLIRRYAREFDPTHRWWQDRKAELTLQRHVLARIRAEGGLESAQFQNEKPVAGGWWSWKGEKMALEWMLRRGRLAISERRSFRRVYDLAERVYPPGPAASRGDYEDDWLLSGLAGNGVAPARHLSNYLTLPHLPGASRRGIFDRNLKRGRIVEVEVEGLKGPCYALPEHLECIGRLPRPAGTTLICPFDSLLWQRARAKELLDFDYRIEIYVPREKRQRGYYALPILHEGRLVGRLDPKLDRQAGRLLIHAIHLEPGFAPDDGFKRGLAASLADLAAWLGAESIALPSGWRSLL
jgi:hypothetical protein